MARSLPPQDTTTAARGRRSVVPRLNRGGAGADRRQRTLGFEWRHGGARVRGELGGAVVAEGERERAIVAKKGGAASACGSPEQLSSRFSRGRCGSSQSERGRASRRA
jgi:hypothetical protein